MDKCHELTGSNFKILMEAVIRNIMTLYRWLFILLCKQTGIRNTICITVMSSIHYNIVTELYHYMTWQQSVTATMWKASMYGWGTTNMHLRPSIWHGRGWFCLCYDLADYLETTLPAFTGHFLPLFQIWLLKLWLENCHRLAVPENTLKLWV